MYFMDDTIVAISSAAGGGARGIIRLSGPEAMACAGKIFQPVTVERGTAPAGKGAEPFRFAYISDSHLYEREVNDRFIRSLLRAV